MFELFPRPYCAIPKNLYTIVLPGLNNIVHLQLEEITYCELWHQVEGIAQTTEVVNP